MPKYVSLIVLLMLLHWSTSCSSSNGCRGGGWYGDRNLTSIAPSSTDKDLNSKNIIECDP